MPSTVCVKRLQRGQERNPTVRDARVGEPAGFWPLAPRVVPTKPGELRDSVMVGNPPDRLRAFHLNGFSPSHGLPTKRRSIRD